MRNKSIDCMKGIGIILVVLVHAGFPKGKYIEIFHMSIFFMISGYCHREAYSENIQTVTSFLLKRIKRLYFPYVLSNCVLVCLHNLFYNWNIYTDNPLFLQADMTASSYGLIGAYSVRDFIFQIIITVGFVGGEQLLGTLWFLRALFEVEIFYVVIDWISRRFYSNRKYFHYFISASVILIGFFLNLKELHIITGVETSCYYFVFFVIGIWLQKIDLQKSYPGKLMLLLSAGWLLVNGFLVTHFQTKIISFPPFYIINGIAGGLLLKSIVNISMQCVKGERLLEYLGEHSMSIMLWHFLSFKIVSFGYIKICDLPDYYLASFPFLKVRYLWIVYTVIGILMPLLAEHTLEMVKTGCQVISVKRK